MAMVRVDIISGTIPEFTIAPLTVQTKENGTTTTVLFTLTVAPNAEVSIDLNSGDLTEGVINNTRLTFNESNFDTPQTITITGVDDNIVDGDIVYFIYTANAVSTDELYNGINVVNVNVTNQDNDTANISVSIANNITTENLENTRFDVALLSKPYADVVLNMSSSNTLEGTLGSEQLLFNSENWNIAQTVTVNGVDDEISDGDIEYYINFEAVTDDSIFNGIIIEPLLLINQDNEGKYGLIIPQAFSPDNDGYNDKFEILGLNKYDKVSIKIYNRWGNLVYQSDKYQNQWNGNSDSGIAVGSELPTGTYFYMLVIEDISKEISGYIFLKR